MSSNDLVINHASVSYSGASLAVEGAVSKAIAIGAPECIAVVNQAGELLAFACMDGAATLALEPAIAKAKTAASLGMPTGALPQEFGANLAAASAGAIVNLGGGLPIVFGGAVIGAIGVGSGTTEQDVAVAQAGREAVLAALGGAA
ncbi:GlcG/HbpS family heme-binding protein [Azorhizobium oxalatiphilum]|nr:heme-binding protein [Azorhizobium oxalatiphilum]